MLHVIKYNYIFFFTFIVVCALSRNRHIVIWDVEKCEVLQRLVTEENSYEW